DSDSSLYYLRSRFYEPGLGRFISGEDLQLWPVVHRYQYGGNNPVIRVDPSGDLSWTVGPFSYFGCGNFRWPVEFRPSRKERGYIIQRNIAIYKVVKCTGEPIIRSRPCPVAERADAGAAEANIFWEIWSVVNEKVFRTNPSIQDPVDVFEFN